MRNRGRARKTEERSNGSKRDTWPRDKRKDGNADCARTRAEANTGSRDDASSSDDSIRRAILSSRRGGETTRARGEREAREKEGGRQWALWRGDATQLRPSYSRRSRHGASGEASERKRNRERERVWTRGLFRRNEPITPRDRCYLFIILLNVDRRGAKASGSFLQHGHCSEIFVWFNEHAWVALRSPSFDSTKTLLLTASQPNDKTCTLCANSLMGSEFIVVFPRLTRDFSFFRSSRVRQSSNPYI